VQCTNKEEVYNFDESINMYFSDEDISSLSITLEGFDSLMLKAYPAEEVSKAYACFFDELTNEKHYSELINKVRSVIHARLQSDMPAETFEKIWVQNDLNNMEQIDFQYNGKYHIFLKQLLANPKYKNIGEYIESIETMGGFSPMCTMFFQHNYENLELNDDTIRLIIAINFITLSSQKL
jgi:hypothetical protein